MPPPPKKNFDRVDEIHRFFMNPALCHTGSRIHNVLSILSKVTGDWGGGGGGGHSTSAFYSVIYLCTTINFSLRHNVLCFSFVVVFYSMYSLDVIINGLMKEVMCNKKWRLKSPLKVNRPLTFIEAP